MRRVSNVVFRLLCFLSVINNVFLYYSASGAIAQKVDDMYNKSATNEYEFRFPESVDIPLSEQYAIASSGKIVRSIVLDTAFSMLEEGNPFVARYNILTNANITPLLQYGIPYFFGGRKMNYVLSKIPDYRTWVSWQDSKIYYKKDVRYFLGLDCRGFLEYVWKQSGVESIPIYSKRSKNPSERRILNADIDGFDDFLNQFKDAKAGDVIALYHPDLHLMIYIGTLADYGYTADDFPLDPSILTYPLVIHCGVNAIYADWFYHLKSLHAQYKKTSVPDGGVSISILGYSNYELINTVRQQRQNTSWVLLPDKSWLTIIPFDDVTGVEVFR